MKTLSLNLILALLLLASNIQAQSFAKPNEGVYEINLLGMAYLKGIDTGAGNYQVVIAADGRSMGGDGKDQRWAITAYNDGAFNIKHLSSGMYLSKGSQKPFLSKNPERDKKWYFTNNGNNTFGIRPYNNHIFLQYKNYMDLMYDSPKTETKRYSDDWTFVWISNLPKTSNIATANVYQKASNIEVHGIYKLFNKTNKYAAAKGAKPTTISASQSNGETNWQPVLMAGGMYMLNSPNSRKKIACTDVYDGAAIILTASSGNDVQWSIQQQADGFCYIINKATGAYLSYSKQTNGLISTKKIDDSCKWEFKK